MSIFNREPPPGPRSESSDVLGAYKEGRRDERSQVTRDIDAKAHDPSVSDAFDRGKREGGMHRRGSGLAALLLILFVAGACGVVYLTSREGSFSGAGAVIDRTVSGIGDTATRAAQGAKSAVDGSHPSEAPPAAPAKP